jgi:hypothetical protein
MLTIETFANAAKVFSAVRFSGTNILKKKQFGKTTQGTRSSLTYR